MISSSLGYLCVWLLLATVNYFAISQIISKAGFSPWWVLCPITPLALVIILFLTLVIDAHTPSTFEPGGLTTTIEGAVALMYLIGITSFLNWVLFLVFAFVRWPVQLAADGYGRRQPPLGPTFGPPSGQVSPPGFASPPPTPGPAMATPAPAGSVAAPVPAAPEADGCAALYEDPLSVSVLTAEPPAPTPPATIFCSWCGEERASDSHAIHYCGPSDRPALYCLRCGTTLDGAPACPSCGTPSTELSKVSRRR